MYKLSCDNFPFSILEKKLNIIEKIYPLSHVQNIIRLAALISDDNFEIEKNEIFLLPNISNTQNNIVSILQGKDIWKLETIKDIKKKIFFIPNMHKKNFIYIYYFVISSNIFLCIEKNDQQRIIASYFILTSSIIPWKEIFLFMKKCKINI